MTPPQHAGVKPLCIHEESICLTFFKTMTNSKIGSKPQVSFELFSSVLNSHLRAHDAASQWYDSIPRDINAAFFDNTAISAMNKHAEFVLNELALAVSEDLAQALPFLTESPLDFTVSFQDGSPPRHIKSVEELLLYIRDFYFSNKQGS